jgi:hypothetical protein
MSFEDAANEVGEAAGQEIVDFSVGLVRVVKNCWQADADLGGSGTLVDLNGICGILTAWHVLDYLMDANIGLVLPTRFAPRRHDLTLESKDVHALKIAYGRNEADGPDLGVLVLPPPIVGSIKAWKTFYNLSRHCDSILPSPPMLDHGLWFLSGFAGDLTEELAPEGGYTKVKAFRGDCAVGWVEREFSSGEFDYLDYELRYGGKREPPASLGGYSGAGLWQVLLKGAPGTLEPEAILLSGVAFYQSERLGDRRFIRCHGRRSLYVQTLTSIGPRAS